MNLEENVIKKNKALAKQNSFSARYDIIFDLSALNFTAQLKPPSGSSSRSIIPDVGEGHRKKEVHSVKR